ncbi:MAG TPA: type VII secretion protein EssC [Friedmanniella sp.]
MAVSFHPHDVAFLLIDYKGGGMANLFADLPHLLGTITNLDGAQSMRALVSINAELKRRQRVFAASGVNHINQYQKLHKNGDVTEPMPHLFLISDEFAELKSEQPEFMDELVSTARIGRSLGIHLILATQKPSGVVNDQIWSNSKFKLALKVADRSDSMEIIKTPDAAEITLPGRAYLQVGNNEIYELFQSAWSGADYAPDKAENHQDDRTIYAITDLGQYRAANEDLSGLDRADTVTSVPTELEAVVRGVREVAQRAEIRPLPRPWLPPLPERIVVTDLHAPALEETWTGAKQPLRPTVGRVDIPGMQTQETLRLDLSGDGHLAVFGSPGYGKSTFLQTLVLDLARTHSPEHLHVYLLDLGTNGLLPLRRLPQVADTVTAEDTDKSAKLVTRLTGELGRRKRLLSEHAVSNLEMYERASGQVMPAVLVVLDSFEGLKGAPAEDAISGLLHSIAREGAGLGLHLVLSGGRPSALRSALSGNIKRQLALRLNDDAEARTIVGRTAVPLEDLPGRGLVRLDQAQVFQTALPAAGEDMFAVLDAIRAECADMDARWQGARPEPIPVVPDRISLSELLRRPEIPRLRAAGIVPVGLDLESVMAVGVDLTRLRQHLVTCVDGGSVAAVLRSLWWAADEADRTRAFLLDDSVGALADLAEESRPGCDRHAVLDAALAELSLRQETRAPAGSPRGPAAVVIADASTISTEIGREHLDDLVRLLTEGPACGMPVLLGAPLSAVGKGVDAVAKVVKRCTSGIVLGAMADQSVLKARNLAFKEPPLAEHEAFLVTDGRAVRVRLPAP